MRNERAFTLLELLIAFALLTTAITISLLLTSGLQRHQRLLWEDTVAQELATSALERALAAPDLPITPAEGQAVNFASTLCREQVLPEVKTVLIVRELPAQPGVRELTARVTWCCAVVVPGGAERCLERTTLRRVAR